MKLTRRQVVVGGLVGGAVAVAGCGGQTPVDIGETEPDDELAASGSGDDDVSQPFQDPVSPSSPIHLTAVTTVASNSSSGVNSIALRNPTGRAMDILEIKFQIHTSLLALVGSGGAVAVKLDLGKIPLTGGFVPVWCLGRADNLGYELIGGTFEGKWRLPKPMYIPAGAAVSAVFQHRGMFVEDAQARVSLSGRVHAEREKAPKTISLPYAAVWASKTMDAAIPDTDSSTEADLANPFREPIQIQRFTGRLLGLTGNPVVSGDLVHPAIGYEMLEVRMVDAHGRPIIRDFTTFRQAFGAETRSWEMEDGVVLEPGGHYNVSLRQSASDLGALSGTPTTQAQIAFNGWREVSGGTVETVECPPCRGGGVA